MSARWAFLQVLAFLALLPAHAKASGQDDAPPLVEKSLTPLQARGRNLYETECAMCHDGRNPGVNILKQKLGPQGAYIARRNDLTPDYIRAAARQGAGVMPRISRVEVTDANLVAIIAYLTRNNSPDAQTQEKGAAP